MKQRNANTIESRWNKEDAELLELLNKHLTGSLHPDNLDSFLNALWNARHNGRREVLMQCLNTINRVAKLNLKIISGFLLVVLDQRLRLRPNSPIEFIKCLLQDEGIVRAKTFKEWISWANKHGIKDKLMPSILHACTKFHGLAKAELKCFLFWESPVSSVLPKELKGEVITKFYQLSPQ